MPRHFTVLFTRGVAHTLFFTPAAATATCALRTDEFPRGNERPTFHASVILPLSERGPIPAFWTSPEALTHPGLARRILPSCRRGLTSRISTVFALCHSFLSWALLCFVDFPIVMYIWAAVFCCTHAAICIDIVFPNELVQCTIPCRCKYSVSLNRLRSTSLVVILFETSKFPFPQFIDI